MKLKVKLFNKKLIKQFSSIISIVTTIFSFIVIFWDIPSKYKINFGIAFCIVFILIYLTLWIHANLLNKIVLKINNSSIEIKIGDIFKENDYKVIAFNEYFDTIVDNKLISERTLNGIFIKDKINNISQFDNKILNDSHLNSRQVEINNNRLIGKKIKYKLGSIFVYDNYFLTAFSKFDENNRAYLSINDYMNFLLEFWNEVDIFYSGKSVAIPLLGSGITRFKEYNTISEQELLELLIWSFKISKIKFTYPSKVSIIIHKSKSDKINFYSLKEK